MKAALALEDGTYLEGTAFGSDKGASGELVFNTSMTGYVEALTDPSYAGQILMMTYPLIGNYGVCREDFESDGVKAYGFVVRELCSKPSNWRSQLNVDELLKEHAVTGIEGIDTRALTRKIRDMGALKARIEVGDELNRQEILSQVKAQPGITEVDFIDSVSVKEPKTYGEKGKYNVVLMDCGVKLNMIRLLVKHGVNVTRVPWDFPLEKIKALKPDGLFLSNGPGDPARAHTTVSTVKSLMGKMPICGICLGHQIMGRAWGANTYKLKFGHRGANQPVKDLETGRVFISSQNHGFAVDAKTLPKDVEVTQINLNDRTIEGMRHKKLPMFCVQYHPEAAPGPHDTFFFFDRFIDLLK
jgi:carbamoyl-phosphate synthase small subunit